MKQIIFSLSEDFKLELVSYAKMYELENNSTEILIKPAKVLDGFAYELHKEQHGNKVLVILDKTDDGLSYVVDNGFLASAGNACLQVRAVSEDTAIESNIVDFRIGRFINATYEPTPEEQGEFEKLQAKVAQNSNDIEELNQTVLDAVAEIDTKADAEEVQNLSTLINTLDAETLDLYQKLEGKANSSEVYSKEAVDALIEGKADVGTVTAMNTLLTQKINTKLSTEDFNSSRDSYVKNGLVNNSIDLTDAEKLKVETWLGLPDNYLTMYNVTPYRVDGDYNPAHKKYVDEQADEIKADLSELDGRVTTLENTPIPEEAIETAVSEYLDTHGGVYVPYGNVYETINKGTLVNNLPSVVSSSGSANAYSYNTYNGILIDTSSAYDTYYFVADKNYELYTNGVKGSYYAICVANNYRDAIPYAGQTLLRGENPIRYRNTQNNLPTVDNKLIISRGDVVSFTCQHGVVEEIFGIDIETKVKTDFSNQVVDNIIKSVYVQYYNFSGQYYTEKVEVFVPSTVGYIRYDFGHSVNSATKSDVWRIDNAYACDDNFIQRYPICANGEWECAIKLKNGSDFSGGAIHGDEVMTEVSFYIDGVEVDIATLTTLTKCSKFEVVEHSNLYNADSESDIIAEHGSKHIFNSDGLSVEQSLKWLGAFDLSDTYLAMFPILKTVTNKLYSNIDFIVEDLPKYITKKTCDSINIYKSDVGFNACFEVPKYPNGMDRNGDYFLCTDNGGLSYNKCYYTITSSLGDYRTTLNELWKSKTNFKLDITL